MRGEFDRPLLLLNDLPGVRVDPLLTPGEAFGTADLAVRVDDERLAFGYLRLDNHQIRELGRHQLTAHLRLRNPLGIGDLATGEFVRSHTGGQTRGTVTYSLPVNHSGTRIGVLLRDQRYRIGGDFEPLLANGDSTRVTLVATHPFFRALDRNVLGSVSLNEVHYRDRIDAVAFVSHSRHRYTTANLSGDRIDGLLGGGRSEIYVEYQGGRVDLDTPAVAAADAAGLGVGGWFHRGRVRLERIQFLSDRSNLLFSIATQRASKNLDFGREVQISGPNAVRAYPSGELIADEGYVARLDYQYTIPFEDGWRSVATAFLDSGRGKINKEPLPGTIANKRDISGYGFSLAAGKRDVFAAELTLAWRASGDPTTDADRHPRLWFTVIQFF